MRVEIADLSTHKVSKQLGDLVSVYEAMYAMPAGAGEGFRPFLIDHSEREGFRLCAAFDCGSGTVVGFAYGFTGYPGQLWRDELAEAVGSDMATEWLTGHFEFAEFGVAPEVRRYGIGTRIYEALFEGLTHERAILTVREENQPARRFYAKHRWSVLHTGFFSAAGRGPYLLMGKLLK
jgi:ribosomal protein S18 acetylase RimI-like enzyme